jgi:hypothetical protein
MTDKVVFRKYRDGDIIALFPRIPWDHYGHQCSSYMHVGQHSGADPSGVISQTKPATPEEYASLARELRGRGYRLKIGRKTTYDDFLHRQEVAKKQWGRK